MYKYTYYEHDNNFKTFKNGKKKGKLWKRYTYTSLSIPLNL